MVYKKISKGVIYFINKNYSDVFLNIILQNSKKEPSSYYHIFSFKLHWLSHLELMVPGNVYKQCEEPVAEARNFPSGATM